MSKITKYIILVLTIGAIVYLLWYFMSIVVYIIISAILSLIGGPLVTLIRKIRIKKWQPSRSLGAGLTLLFLWILIFTFFSIIIPVVVKEANQLSKINVDQLVENLNEPIQRVQGFFNKDEVDKEFSLTEYAAEKIVSFLDVSQLSGYIKIFLAMLGDIFIAVFSISFITFFFLKEEQMFGNTIILLVPSRYTDEATHIINSSSKLLKRYFIGIGIEVLSVGSLVSLGLWFIGLDFSHIVIMGAFAGIINVIPYIGPIIGSLFGIIIGIATHLDMPFYPDLLQLIGLIAMVYVTVQVIDNVLFQPLIYSSSVNAHPLEIFLVILIAGNVAGIVGMVLAIPSYTILRVVAKEFFNNSRIVKKLTSKISD